MYLHVVLVVLNLVSCTKLVVSQSYFATSESRAETTYRHEHHSSRRHTSYAAYTTYAADTNTTYAAINE